MESVPEGKSLLDTNKRVDPDPPADTETMGGLPVFVIEAFIAKLGAEASTKSNGSNLFVMF